MLLEVPNSTLTAPCMQSGRHALHALLDVFLVSPFAKRSLHSDVYCILILVVDVNTELTRVCAFDF